MNFNIHDSAKEQINKLLKESSKSDKSFRIYIRRVSGWLGPVWDIALDEPTDKDDIFTACEYKVFMRKEAAQKINNVEIFYKYGISKSGFRVLTDLEWNVMYKYEDWAKPIN